MTNDEWDRKAEFLLNQQAKFEAGMQELKEVQAISEQKIAKASDVAAQAAEAAGYAVEAVTQLTDITTHLTTTMTDGFLYVFDSMKHTNDKIDVLVNSQMHTDESLRDIEKRQQDLAALYERHIRKYHRRRNGSEN